jgi:hypothetical protein
MGMRLGHVLSAPASIMYDLYGYDVVVGPSLVLAEVLLL